VIVDHIHLIVNLDVKSRDTDTWCLHLD